MTVTPAQAGVYSKRAPSLKKIPAYAGMTGVAASSDLDSRHTSVSTKPQEDSCLRRNDVCYRAIKTK
ncbi:hypothetical protein ACPV5O_17060 [Vibrio maritimus]|uniref:hypothetical protein n=1 Tax=Vibrio maritimus TaxID=990268 RepID=UPI00406946D1